MKHYLLFPVLIAAFSLQAQTQLPKIRLQKTFWSVKYELGDKDTKPAEIRTHLQKNNQDAYYLWRRADALQTQSLVWTTLGTLSMLVGILADGDGAKLGGYGSAVLFYSVGLGTGLASNGKRQKSIDAYNKAAGY